jgi:hypothetical protein
VFWQPGLPAASPLPRLSVTLLRAQEVCSARLERACGHLTQIAVSANETLQRAIKFNRAYSITYKNLCLSDGIVVADPA